MNIGELLPVLILTVAAVADLGSTWRMWARYKRVGPSLKRRERLILQSYVVICVVMTAVAGVFAILTTRRMLGFEPLDGATTVTWVLSIGALFIPTYLELNTNRVAAEPRD